MARSKSCYDVMSVPGRRDDGADTAWFVVDRCRQATDARHVGDGETARLRAFGQARRLNAGGARW
jgi:hypothetical protein